MLFKRKKREIRFPGTPKFRGLREWVGGHATGINAWGRGFVVSFVFLHLGLVFFFPGGENRLFALKAPGFLSYTTLFPPQDVTGFQSMTKGASFVVYRVFSQEGTMAEGVFPDNSVSPQIRYERWSALADRVRAAGEGFHQRFLDHLVAQLPGKPLRVELLSAQWGWKDVGPGIAPDKRSSAGEVHFKKLGVYEVLTKKWHPYIPKQKRKRKSRRRQ